MVRPLCKYAADVSSKGYKPEQMLPESRFRSSTPQSTNTRPAAVSLRIQP
jgi:hypothetical protein